EQVCPALWSQGGDEPFDQISGFGIGRCGGVVVAKHDNTLPSVARACQRAGGPTSSSARTTAERSACRASSRRPSSASACPRTSSERASYFCRLVRRAIWIARCAHSAADSGDSACKAISALLDARRPAISQVVQAVALAA